MINNKQIVAVIPAKDDSKRIPDKNFQLLLGESLLGRKIIQLKNSQYIDRIVVGTKSQKVIEEAKKYGAEIVIEKEYHYAQSANKMIHNLSSKGFTKRLTVLIAVRSAILHFMPDFTNLRVRRKPRLHMSIDKHDVTLNVA